MVASTINVAEVCTKFKIGQYIVEDEQKGKSRAAYGKQVLIHLSARLIEKHGEGWSVETLTLCRKFFNVYSNFVNSVYEIEGEYKFTLSWSHRQIAGIRKADYWNFALQGEEGYPCKADIARRRK